MGCKPFVAVLVLGLSGCGDRSETASTETKSSSSNGVEASESSPVSESATASSESAGPSTETGSESGPETSSESETGPFDPTPSDVLDQIGCPPSLPETSDARWQAFVDRRESWLFALSEPILACVDQHDTEHPAFHGCIDWHSAVHATWALHALYRMTRAPAYLAAANAVLDPVGLAGELDDIGNDNLPAVELMYGRAWFLLLARERELALGDQPGATDLRPHAELIADQLEGFFSGLSPAQLENFIAADDYFNASWALLNLHRWATHVGDSARTEWIELLVTDIVMPSACPLVDEIDFNDDFFPPCLHRAMLVLSVLPPAQTQDWLAAELPGAGEFELEPLCEPSPAHVAGLNFSRAWGLWSLWQASGDTHYRDLYVAHVQTHVTQPAYWAEDYWAHSHWIAQFGVHAIWLSWF
jgi:hypothetical protein